MVANTPSIYKCFNIKLRIILNILITPTHSKKPIPRYFISSSGFSLKNKLGSFFITLPRKTGPKEPEPYFLIFIHFITSHR